MVLETAARTPGVGVVVGGFAGRGVSGQGANDTAFQPEYGAPLAHFLGTTGLAHHRRGLQQGV